MAPAHQTAAPNATCNRGKSNARTAQCRDLNNGTTVAPTRSAAAARVAHVNPFPTLELYVSSTSGQSAPALTFLWGGCILLPPLNPLQIPPHLRLPSPHREQLVQRPARREPKNHRIRQRSHRARHLFQRRNRVRRPQGQIQRSPRTGNRHRFPPICHPWRMAHRRGLLGSQ
jgi:hypothetical protein